MKFVPLVFIILLLSGCESVWLGKSYVRKDRVVASISELKAQQANVLDAKEREIKSELNLVINGKMAQIQRAANSLYSADIAFGFYKEPTRLDNIIHNRVLESSAALGVGPTLEAIKEENMRLKIELDENLTSIEQLRTTHEAKIKENSALVELTKKHELAVIALEKEKVKIKDEFTAQIDKKQEELNRINDQLLVSERKSSDERKIFEKNKKIIASITSILAIACIVGSFYSPIGKDKLAMGAGLFGLISIGIMLVAPIHVAIFFGIVSLVGGIWAIKHFGLLDRTNSNLIGFIQHKRDSDPELYENKFKEDLAEWNSKYKKVKGKIEKVKDAAVEKYIEGKLIEKEKI